jgi:hypothetical protein
MLTHRLIPGAVVVFAASLAMGAPDAIAADTTATTVALSSPASVWGESVRLTATVTDTVPPVTIPTGSVQFTDGVAPIGAPVALAISGEATIDVTALEIGMHAISAVYSPDTTDFVTSRAIAMTLDVARAQTTTTLGADPNPTVAGQDATFTATVAATPPGAGTPTGTVHFGPATGGAYRMLDMGRASLVAYDFAGLYLDLVTYNGDPHFNSSTGSVVFRVNKAATTTTLTISPNPAAPGAAIAFRAIVGIRPPGDVAPGGSLQFSIDGAPVGAAIGLGGGVIGYEGNLNAPPGNQTYLVGVRYSGDEDTEPSEASVAVTVLAPALPSTAASAPAGAPTVTVSHLSAMASTLTTALRLRGFAALTTTIETVAAGPGLLEQKVYAPAAARAARSAATKRVMIASGRHRFTAAGTGTLRLKLTAAGRRAIRHAKSLKLTIVTRFAPAAGEPVVATKRLTVRAKPKRSATRRGGQARGWQLLGAGVRQ